MQKQQSASIQATVLTLSICWSCWALMAAFTWSLSRFLYKEKEHHSETGDNYQLTNDAIVTKMFKSTSKGEDFLTITSDLKTVITELGNAPATLVFIQLQGTQQCLVNFYSFLNYQHLSHNQIDDKNTSLQNLIHKSPCNICILHQQPKLLLVLLTSLYSEQPKELMQRLLRMYCQQKCEKLYAEERTSRRLLIPRPTPTVILSGSTSEL